MKPQLGAVALARPVVPLRVDIVVHGRFHGFALARGLLELGHDAVVHTNYPRSVVARFGVPPSNVRSFVGHGVASRVVNRLGALDPRSVTEPALHKAFGSWAAHSVRTDADLVYGFSGVMEEYLRTPRLPRHQLRTLVRGSAHIAEQARLLEEEEKRIGVPVERPTPWMIAREQREYDLADAIFVLSRFAYDSFAARAVPESRLLLNPLGVDVTKFSATPKVVDERERRIVGGTRLTVLNVGTLNAQKGAVDFFRMAAELRGRFDFQFVGTTVTAETRRLLSAAAGSIEITPRVAENKLPEIYANADLFIFPTIQDGFAAVLRQASSAGLPILATTNCSAPDFIVDGETGWVLPIRDADAFIRQLIWCDENRGRLATMARQCANSASSRSWRDMAQELVRDWTITKGQIH